MPRENIVKILDQIPQNPGVYKMLSQDGEVLYIGKAKNLYKRVIYYTSLDLPLRLSRMVYAVSNLEYIITNSEEEALLLEARLIKTHQPKFNILLKDDKSFPYIILRKDHDYPQILKHRSKTVPKEKYFGPFASSTQVDITLEELQKIFKLRSCNDNYFAARTRPCLQYQIKRCTAPCVNKISNTEYQDLVSQVEYFLSGKTIALQKQLSEQMEILSANLEYEKAAEIRDKIKALKYVQLKFGSDDLESQNTDIIVVSENNDRYAILVAFYRNSQFYGYKIFFPTHTDDATDKEILSYFLEHFYADQTTPEEVITNVTDLNGLSIKCVCPLRGRKFNLLKKFISIAEEQILEQSKIRNKHQAIFESLKDIFHLKKIPERIEIYDNSHIMGKYAVGAMVVATQDGFQKQEYRAYNIEASHDLGGDDYGMLREVMTKRLNKIIKTQSGAPELMIIDGGKGHFSTVQNLMNQLNIYVPFVCMSKGPDRNAGNEQFYIPGHDVFTIDNKDPVMKYIQLLRDEAHNFAIKKHRIKRSESIYSSTLDHIEGIGKKRKKDLLHFFGSITSIKNASIEEIANVPGIGKAVASKLFKYIKK